jgi:hypothetical protein
MDRLLGNIIAIVLTLLALVGLAYAGYNGFQNHKANVVVNDVTQLIANARAGFSSSNNGYLNFTTGNVPSLITGGIFPSAMVRGTTVVDAWGNPVTLSSTNNASQGVIGFGGGGAETAAQCVKVTTGMKDYVSLDVNGTVFTQANLPDSATAGAACSATATFAVTFQ